MEGVGVICAYPTCDNKENLSLLDLVGVYLSSPIGPCGLQPNSSHTLLIGAVRGRDFYEIVWYDPTQQFLFPSEMEYG